MKESKALILAEKEVDRLNDKIKKMESKQDKERKTHRKLIQQALRMALLVNKYIGFKNHHEYASTNFLQTVIKPAIAQIIYSFEKMD